MGILKHLVVFLQDFWLWFRPTHTEVETTRRPPMCSPWRLPGRPPLLLVCVDCCISNLRTWIDVISEDYYWDVGHHMVEGGN